ncbi:MAG: hypothetical protein ACJLS2_12795 [Microcella pacifica]
MAEKLRRARLVVVDELVGVAPGEAPLARQLAQAAPFGVVRGGVGVEIHLFR